jgi:hypothetical protein
MKRLVLLVIVAALPAVGILYGLRHAERTSHAAVTTLLPRGTVFLAHVPNFNNARHQWHESDLYQLYREPAVQDFLQKPLARAPQRGTTSQTLSEIEQLDPKDAFLAVTSIENNNPRFAGGFRFRGSRDDAERIIGKWRAEFVKNDSTRESVDYERHKIDIVGTAPNQIATVYDGDWFLASNDLAELKTLLDRVDQRAKDRQSTLEADENFRAALAHMPSSYALLFYLQPKGFSEKLVSLHAAIGRPGRPSGIEQVRSICGTTRFDKGKLHDVLFVGMPKVAEDMTLKRSSATLGTADTFFYLATLLNPEKFDSLSQAGGIGALGAWFQKFFQATSRSGITVDDWRAAFELELGSLADWPADARWPSLIATIPVKDPARANKIANMLTLAIDEDAPWTKTEKEGVRYYFMATPASLFAITPTIALSDRMMVAGLDSVSVEAAMKRNRSGPDWRSATSGLSNSKAYNAAVRSVPTPTNFFGYVDTALLYARLDAALRPMLLMSAAFMPAISDYVDVGKLPEPNVVTKHLSPIVSSQRYDGDGYVAESIGPVTLNQAAIGIGLPAVFWALGHQRSG